MMRSLYAGVSGLQNHQTRMDVIGNNISNVNTTGFKKGRVNFQDMLSQSMSGAARPTETKGGVNPKQVGLGMMVASIDTIHTQGSLQTTGNNMDMAISGNGFFILKDGDKSFYTRAGAFNLDKDGTLVNPGTGLRVQGWMSREIGGDYILDTAANTEDIIIPMYSKDAAKATQNVDFKCNLFSEMAIVDPNEIDNMSEADLVKNTWTSSIMAFDHQGSPMDLRFRMFKTDINTWQARIEVYKDDPTNPGQKIRLDPNDINLSTTEGEVGEGGNTFFNINFDNLGRIASVTDANENTIADGALNINLNVRVRGETPEGEVIGLAEGENQEVSMRLNLGEAGRVRTDDGVGITQFSSGFSTKPFRQDGFTMGYLEGVKVDDTGCITGVYSNGNNRILAQVALANFSNVGGLEKAGETNFVQSNNSGEADISPAGTVGKGKIMAGALEMSNVDLSEQFTDMIVTQRGFQANSKTIQTTDQMLQELLQLKR